jgi:hypothetical protein
MPHRRWQRSLALHRLLALGAGIAGCDSSNAVPQTVDASGPADARPESDASPIDASVCACPGTELLSRQHLIDLWEFASPSSSAVVSITDCPMNTDLPISGTCSFYDLGEASGVYGSTRGGNSVLGYASWYCQHSPFAFGQIDHAARCVRPLDRTGEIAEGCTCPPFETPTDRIFYVQQAVTIPDDETGEVSSSCPAGTILLGGACDIDYSAFLIGQGSYREDPQSWHCSWYAYNGTQDGRASAICLNPPAPDAVTGEPVAPEVIEYIFTEDTLPANGTRLVDATCAPGDTLIAGGCQVEDPSIGRNGLVLKRIGMAKPEDNRPNTWNCAWRNPTTATPKVFALATCLKPAAISPAK